ncbi:testis-expressed protein 10 homolog [Phlebotomus argentipes]|uniref:testis-expressed protein 10 homolog n=1 Tax=Phlebotomus argentipes TaxID=94469 RepID=UPI002892BD2C|nr:testis-expressed protein 10 homolog [Phlebotomus argentipes]
MAKGKHKKALRSEKAKVKLKGAKLPKGLNITKTDFKVKKILIREQLKDTETPEGIQRVNIKDLVSKLRHNNSSIKQDTLKHVKEILASSPEDLFPRHLGDVVQTVGQMSLDVDREVRRESFRCLQTLLESIDTSLMEPFFDMLSSYLRCAMTHLQNNIQEDSLLLLDVLLQNVPHLVAKDSDKIFTNFLDMVSKLRSESQPGRTLSLNLGKKITAVKWRIRVLERLLKLLQGLNASLRIADTETAVKPMQFNAEGTFYAPIVQKPQELWFEEVSGLFIRQMSSLKQKTAAKGTDFSESQKIIYYVEQMVPLLVETWLEIRPQNTEEGDVALGQEAASTISLIVGILEELWNMVVRCDQKSQTTEMQTWLRKSYNRDFCQAFMTGFPYNFTGKARSVSAQEENLRLCYLFCCLSDSSGGTNAKLSGKIIDFTSASLTTWRSQTPSSWACLHKVLRIVLVENGKSWSTRSVAHLRKLSQKLLDVHTKAKLSSELSGAILVLISHALSSEEKCLVVKETTEQWFQQLRSVLANAEKMPQSLVDALAKLYTISREFVNFLSDQLPDILSNISRMEITESKDDGMAKRQLVNFIYWLPGRITEDHLNLIADEDLRRYATSLNSLKKC